MAWKPRTRREWQGSPNVFPGTVLPSGRIELDEPNRYRSYVASCVDAIAHGDKGNRVIVTVDEQWSAEAKDFYFKILKWLRDGDMAGWTEVDQSTFFKEQFNEGRSIQELSREKFDIFLESVIEWSAREAGFVVPEANPLHRYRGEGL